MRTVEAVREDVIRAQDGLSEAKKQNDHILGKYETILYGRDMARETEKPER